MSDAARPDAPPRAAQRPGWLGLRALAPRGLLGRTLLIVLIPLVILQAVALRIFYGSHLDVISRRLAAGLAGDVGMVAELITRLPAAEERAWIFREASWRLDLGFAFEPGGRLLQQGPRPASLPLLPLEEDLAEALAERVRLPVDADWATDPRRIFIRVQLPDGVLHVEANRKRLFTGTLYLFVIWLVGSSILLFALAALFLKNQVRAIRRLATAAEEFGMGRDAGPIKPEGAAEVRQAAAAFNRMRANIRRFVQQRTEMLAGISHDLRTPLTRLRLGLAMLPQDAAEDAAEMTRDVEEMEDRRLSRLRPRRAAGGGAPGGSLRAGAGRRRAQRGGRRRHGGGAGGTALAAAPGCVPPLPRQPARQRAAPCRAHRGRGARAGRGASGLRGGDGG
jgi:two-component system osmolarity sensor histidine kinase EnvZ